MHTAENHGTYNHFETGLREECGVFGIYDLDGREVSSSIYYGLEALQHRGQESCGIAVSDTAGPKGRVLSHKGLGLVNEVFKEDTLHSLKGNIGIGHVRYSTSGSTSIHNAQPLVLNYIKGSLALAHNGNLVNARELREQMEYGGAIFHTSIDSEVIAYCIAQERVKSATVEEAVLRAMKKIRGAYGLVLMSPRKLVGVRDPYGLKPLCIGKRDNSFIIASESCALTSIGAEFIRDVKPGEIVTITKDGEMHSQFLPEKPSPAPTVFLNIYILRGWTAAWTVSGSMTPESARALPWPGTIPWRRIWLPAFRIPASPPQRDTQKKPGSPSPLLFTKTATSGAHSSSPARRNGNPASKSS